MAHAEGRGSGQVVVGLGNPGPEYQDTRHNVGQRVLDVLAKTVRGSWRRDGATIVARGRWRGEEAAAADEGKKPARPARAEKSEKSDK